ncbi:unnamed protein product, partial [Symbiodinium sp. KB8]
MRAVSEVTLSGGTACFERPPAKLRACGLPGDDQGLSDFMVNLFAATGTLAAAVVAFVQAERALRESKEGRTQAAADRMMEAFTPEKKKAEVVQRGIMRTIEERILRWDARATIIAGRFGAGKSVAVEEVLRDMQGVYVHQVRVNDWEEKLYKRLGLDGPDMLEEVLRRVGGKLNRPPILVLEIPRTAKRGMDTVSSFAKDLSSDRKLAHAGTRRLSRPVSLCCGGYRALDLDLTCGDYKGPAMLAATKEEMKAKVAIEVQRFLDSCKIKETAAGRKILEALMTDRNSGPGKGVDELSAGSAVLPKDVLLFLNECEMKMLDGVTRAGANILTALVQDRRAGGRGVGALTGGKGAKPRDVAKWIRNNKVHPVIWH